MVKPVSKNRKIKKVYICSSFYGCILNSSLLTRIQNFLIGNGIEISDDPDKSEAIIIGTCANVSTDEKKAIKFIREYIKKYSKTKKIIVTGCLPDINPDFFKGKTELISAGVRKIKDLDNLFGTHRSISTFKSNTLYKKFCLDISESEHGYYKYFSSSKYYIKITEGCLNSCSYCVIKKAKGTLRSKPLDSVLEEFQKGLRSGYNKFELLGDDCGGYGQDLGSSFAELLKRISLLKGDFEILITNFAPGKLIDLYPSIKKILPKLRVSYINLPLQSGNSRILKLMNRKYSLHSVIKIVKDIKKISPHTEMNTHFIYCFPSETSKEFMDSVKMADFFDSVVFFLYSKRKGTRAADMQGEISIKEKDHRTAYLKNLIIKDPQKYYFGNIKTDTSQTGLIKRSANGKKQDPTVLLFKNIFYSQRKEENDWISQATLYLASALKKEQINVTFSSFKFFKNREDLKRGYKKLEELLKKNPDINFIGISLCEDFFEEAKRLIAFIRKRTDAFIGIGCVMPTLTPRPVFMHLPKINFLIRGAGEVIFPRLVKILDDKNINSRLDSRTRQDLLQLPGFVFRNKDETFFSSPEIINELQNYDSSVLDFSFIERENLSEGLNLFTSRGCYNNCFFCTTPGKGKFIAKSFEDLKKILNDYRKRIREIFGNTIPPDVYKISFNDDDFLADPKRAISFFHYLKDSPFYINFFQTGINSFYKRRDNRYTDIMNRELSTSISPAVFGQQKNRTDLYIGTENFCDKELKRLGKGYGFSKIKKAVKTLSDNKIYQAHHLIASNQLTAPEDIMDNLIRICGLRFLHGAYFRVLDPIIPHLVSLFPSISYKKVIAEKRKKYLNIKKTLSLKGHPEYDYPLVENDIPVNTITREIIPIISGLFSTEKDYLKILDLTLCHLLILSEKRTSMKREILSLIKHYQDYRSIISKQIKCSIKNDHYKLQLMISSLKKTDQTNKDTLKENIIYKTVDLLLSSSRERVHLDLAIERPLSELNLLKKIIIYARKRSIIKKKKISFSMTACTPSLNKETVDLLKREDLHLKLSVTNWDGNQSVSPILDHIVSKKIESTVVLLVTPGTVHRMSRNFYTLLKTGLKRIIIDHSLGINWSREKCREFLLQLDMIKKKNLEYKKD